MMGPRKRRVWVGLAAVATAVGSLGLGVCLTVAGDERPRPPAERSARSTAPEGLPSEEAAPPAVRIAPSEPVSPLTPSVVENLRTIAGRMDRHGNVFGKVGDSATVSRAFLECFGGDLGEVRLGEHGGLQPTVDFFRGGNAGGIDPFRRNSAAAGVGWSTRQVLLGDPSPLLEEVRAISPRYAFVLNGGNDVEGRDPARYANRMLRAVHHLEVRGVIPILGSILPRNDDADADRWVRRFNGVTRAIARGKRLPYIDFHGQLSRLPRRGLAGDGVHPNVLISDNRAFPCDLSSEGLQHGNNRRNLLALQVLDGLRRTVIDGEAAPDPEPEPISGEGTVSSPFHVKTLPFTDMRSTAEASSDALDAYPACSAEHDESGPEVVYQLRVDRPLTVRAWAFSEGEVDVDVHLLRAEASTGACVTRDDTEVRRTLDPGLWYVVVDTFVHPDEGARAGEYLFVLDADEPSDGS